MLNEIEEILTLGYRDRDAEPEVRYRERSRDRGGRHPADPVPRLSDEDLRRYEFLQRRREEREILSREVMLPDTMQCYDISDPISTHRIRDSENET